MLLRQWADTWLILALLCIQKLQLYGDYPRNQAMALQCCYFDPSKKMAQPECYKENRKWDWCFSCESSSCWFMNLQHDRTATNGIRFMGGDVDKGADMRHPAKAVIREGCNHYNEEMGQLKILVGRFCFCRDLDFCNKKDYRKGARGTVNSGSSRNKADVQPTNGTIRTNKTETLILFILIGIMVLFVAFCCIVLNQTCCVLGLCSN